MSIDERLREIYEAIAAARLRLDVVEALMRGFIRDERPTIELLATVAKLIPEPPK